MQQQADPVVIAAMQALEEAVALGLNDLADEMVQIIESRGGDSQMQDVQGGLALLAAAITAYFVGYIATVRDGNVQIARGMVQRNLDTDLPLLRQAGASSAYQRSTANTMQQYPTQLEQTFYTRTNPADGQRFDYRIVTVRDDAVTTVRNLIRQGVAQGRSARDMARDVEAYLRPEYQGPGKISPLELQRRQTGARNVNIRRNKLPYEAMRIARSEAGNTYRGAEAEMYRGTIFEDDLFDWVLSNSHPGYDSCDELAKASPYAWNQRPHSHPNCLCAFIKRRPNIDEIRRRLQDAGLL